MPHHVAVVHHEEADAIVVKVLAFMKRRSKKKVKYETAACGRELRQLLCRKYGVAI
jgi:hypothetical protein